MSKVYVYSHIFPISAAPPEPVPFPVFVKAKEPTPVSGITHRWVDPYGGEHTLTYSAEEVAARIEAMFQHVGCIRIRGEKPTSAEIERSKSLALQHAMNLLTQYKMLSEFAQSRGSAFGPPNELLIEAARFVQQSNVDLSRFGLSKSFLDIVLAHAAVAPTAELESVQDEEPPTTTRRSPFHGKGRAEKKSPVSDVEDVASSFDISP